jgi:hypothetical protein
MLFSLDALIRVMLNLSTGMDYGGLTVDQSVCKIVRSIMIMWMPCCTYIDKFIFVDLH